MYHSVSCVSSYHRLNMTKIPNIQKHQNENSKSEKHTTEARTFFIESSQQKLKYGTDESVFVYVVPKLSQSHPNVISESSQSHPRCIPRTSQNHTKIIPKPSQSHPKVIPKSSQIHPKSIPKSSQTHTKCIPNASQMHTKSIPNAYHGLTPVYHSI